MKKIINYLVLPKEQTEAEVKHVTLINKVALTVCFLHVPIFGLLGYLCGTGVDNALLLSALVLAGPTGVTKL